MRLLLRCGLFHVAFLAAFSWAGGGAWALSQQSNITLILAGMEGFDLFNRLLSRTGVAGEVNSRTSLTILAPHDSIVQPLLDSYIGGIPTQQMSDILRYHVLLQYMDFGPAAQAPADRWSLVTTLYQTTGRAAGNSGAVNVSMQQNETVEVGLPLAGAPPNATILSTLKKIRYSLNVVQISSILIPAGLKSPVSPYSSINITNELAKTDRFNFFLLFLQITGVDQIFENNENKEGVTIFAPTDQAFQKFRVTAFKMLSAEQKILVLEYHALNTFYPLGTLNTFKNPVTPTIATLDPRSGGAGQFTVNVSSVNGVVTISDGTVNAPVIATILEHEPVAIFAIDELLFPEKFLDATPSPKPPSPPPPPPAAAPPSRSTRSPPRPSPPHTPPTSTAPSNNPTVPSASTPPAPPTIPTLSPPPPPSFIPPPPDAGPSASPASPPAPPPNVASHAHLVQICLSKLSRLSVLLGLYLLA